MVKERIPAMTEKAGSVLNHAFGSVLRSLRQDRHLSQEELAFETDLARNFISLMERGLRSPSLDTMMSLCGALDVTLQQLAGRVEDEFRARTDGHDTTQGT